MELLQYLHGSVRTYGNDCAISGALNVIIIGSKFLGLSIVLRIILSQIKLNINQYKSQWKYWIERSYIISFWLAILISSFAFPILASFQYISPLQNGILLFLFYSIGIIHQFLRMKYLIPKYIYITQIVFSIFISLLFSQFFQKGCLCVFNDAYGMNYLDTMQFSTEMSRKYWIKEQICKDNEICHLYATLPQNAINEVIINIHTGKNIDQIYLQFVDYFKCQQFSFPQDIEYLGQRKIFSCYVFGLQSGTDYQFKIISNGQVLMNTNYRTMPNKNDEINLKIFFGGDFGYSQEGLDLIGSINEIDPHIILIGGDIAYDNGNIHCYYSFDLFLDLFEQQFSIINRIIPFVFSVGNHDVGFNDYPLFNITVSDESGPLYFTYFPQRIDENKQIPQIMHRRTFNYHLIQHIILFGLDSGYLYPHKGIQSDWMINILEQYSNYLPIAHYHVPFYPSCYDIVSIWIMRQKSNWLEIFDQYKFKAAFENHVHSYKRTFPLFNDSINPLGTIYFGDGSMGVEEEEECDEIYQTFLNGSIYEGLFEEVRKNRTTHFWLMEADSKLNVNFRAYDFKKLVINGSDCNYNWKDDL